MVKLPKTAAASVPAVCLSHSPAPQRSGISGATLGKAAQMGGTCQDSLAEWSKALASGASP